MRGVTYPQLKECITIIQDHYNISYDDSYNIVAFYKAEYNYIMMILSHDFSDIPRAAASVGVALSASADPVKDNKKDTSKRTKKGTAKTKISQAKKSPKKPSIKADTIKSGDIIPTIDGDIIQNTDITGLPAGLPDMIAAALDNFTSKYNIDLYKARQQQWAAACSFVGQNVFKTNKSILADTPPKNGGFRYDLNKIYLMVGIWSDYCSLYSKVPLISDYCLFVGIDKSMLYANSGKYTQADQATPARVRLLKKLHDLQESGLASAIVDGRQNPTGALAALNHWHGWTKTTEIIHTNAAPAASAPALPVFDIGQGGLIEDNGGGMG